MKNRSGVRARRNTNEPHTQSPRRSVAFVEKMQPFTERFDALCHCAAAATPGCLTCLSPKRFSRRPMSNYDVIVIGSGPGGEGAAMKAAKEGRSVAVIERYHLVGGGCTHWGTIPSKALRHTISTLAEFRSNGLFQAQLENYQPKLPELLRAAEGVIRRQVSLRHGFYERNHVRLMHGNARFVDGNTLEVEGPNGGRERLRGSAFVIASGARPYHPADVDFSHPRVRDSDTLLKLDFTPSSVTI